MNFMYPADKFRNDHNTFIRELSEQLNYPGDEQKVIRALKAVLYTLRDRISIQQSFHVLAQLPLFLKMYYIEGWRYREKPIRLSSVKSFAQEVKLAQIRLGETQFDCEESALVNIILASLRNYLDDGTVQHIFSELPVELHTLFM